MNPQNKNCIGENVSPPLRWSGAPEKTKSYMIMLFDPAGRVPLGVVHWLAYDIPASKTSLKEGEASKPSTEFKGGKNITGGMTYFGPCPPAGVKPHPYTLHPRRHRSRSGGARGRDEPDRSGCGAAWPRPRLYLAGHTLRPLSRFRSDGLNCPVVPAKAGTQGGRRVDTLDPCYRRGDDVVFQPDRIARYAVASSPRARAARMRSKAASRWATRPNSVSVG